MRYHTKKLLIQDCKRNRVTKKHGTDRAYICRVIHKSDCDSKRGQKYWSLIYFPQWVIIGGRYGNWNEINIKERL